MAFSGKNSCALRENVNSTNSGKNQNILDKICIIVHISIMWPINYTPEYEDWFTAQEEENQMAINAKVLVLSKFGPNLGRPYVDTIQGSKFANLKELRIKFKISLFRILFCFDKNRNCWLLIGGNKKGKNEEHFYRRLIKQAEDLIEKYPEITEERDA